MKIAKEKSKEYKQLFGYLENQERYFKVDQSIIGLI